ncbi:MULTISPECIES: YbgA family protein [Providencia]|uniref:YbgA family protein n=1 Tax=Providencia TaxID=586 RepID=UPI00217ED9EA|nr:MULTISPECIES: YbgA family protein [Providencia]MCR4080014.1 YbgA family protein [Providencia stuartii]
MESIMFNVVLFGDVEFPAEDITSLTESHIKLIPITALTEIKFAYQGVICDEGARQQLLEQLPENTPLLTTHEWSCPEHLDRFFIQLYTGYRLTQLAKNLTHHQIICFHSRHKYLLMAYSPKGYKATGKFVAGIQKNSELTEVYTQYRHQLLDILATTPARKLQVNALQHIQGYFKYKATRDEKVRLGWLINDYQAGYLSINNPLSMILQLLTQYPDSYISEQLYLSPYPGCEKIRALLQF